MVCMPMGILRISFAMPASSAASQASSSDAEGAEIVMFDRISPMNSLLSCMTEPIWRRRERRFTLRTSCGP